MTSLSSPGGNHEDDVETVREALRDIMALPKESRWHSLTNDDPRISLSRLAAALAEQTAKANSAEKALRSWREVRPVHRPHCSPLSKLGCTCGLEEARALTRAHFVSSSLSGGHTDERHDVSLVVIAYQHPRYQTGGESKRDHACTQEEFDKGSEGRTLCGRPLGRWYFPRGNQQVWEHGAWAFECRICAKVSSAAAVSVDRGAA